MMTKRIETKNMNIDACARQQEENDRIPVKTVHAQQERGADVQDKRQTDDDGEMGERVNGDTNQEDTEVLDALERCVFVLYKISVSDIRAFENAGNVARCCLEILKKRGMEDDWYEWLDE